VLPKSKNIKNQKIRKIRGVIFSSSFSSFSRCASSSCSMSFGFQFEDDELDDEYKGLQEKQERSHGQTSTAESSSSARNEAQAKKHTLKEFIATLPNRISYSSIIVPLQDSQTTTLFRRDLFDARFQLINDYDHDGEEEDNEKTGKKVDLESYSVGTDTDLIPGVYEGGFKTWECSLDLVTYLHDRIGEEKESSSWLEERRITEIGCGTAMPSMYLFSLMLQDREQGKKVGSKLELCDFNEQVLRLVSWK
jgi:protein-histidine N-methyltransferase